MSVGVRFPVLYVNDDGSISLVRSADQWRLDPDLWAWVQSGDYAIDAHCRRFEIPAGGSGYTDPQRWDLVRDVDDPELRAIVLRHAMVTRCGEVQASDAIGRDLFTDLFAFVARND